MTAKSKAGKYALVKNNHRKICSLYNRINLHVIESFF
jgi:hypothetical protein